MSRRLGIFVCTLVLGTGIGVADDEAGAEVGAAPVLVAPMGHAQTVLAVAYSPDGAYVLTGSDDSTAKLWEAETGREIRSFTGHTRGVHSVAFSPDGARVLTASTDGTVRSWDPRTGRAVRSFDGHEGPVHAAIYSRDGAQVLSASDDGTARLWDAATGQEVRRFEGHAKGLRSVAISPDGTQVLTGAADRTVRLWALATGQTIRSFDGHSETVTSLAFSPDGTQFLTGYWGRAPRRWSMTTGEDAGPLAGPTMGSPSVAWSPDGARLLTASRDGAAIVWSAATGQIDRRLAGHKDEVHACAFSPDGTHVMTGSSDRTARLWDVGTGQMVHRLGGQVVRPLTVGFSPDGAQMATGFREGAGALWTTASGQIARRLEGHAGALLDITYSPDGASVLTSSFDRTARRWDAATGRELRSFTGHEGAVHACAVSPDGALVLTGSEDRSARLWDANTGREVRRLDGHTGPVHSVAFSPDARLALTGSRDGTVRIWNTTTGRSVRSLRGHTQWVQTVAFSPDGQQILTGSWDRTARLWDAATGRELRRFSGHLKGVHSVAFSPDGALALSTSVDGMVWLWRTDTGRPVHRLDGHTGAVFAGTFSTDGGRTVTASDDGTIRLWDVSTGKELCSLRSFRDGTWAAVDAEGRYDASHGGDVPGLHWVVGLEVIALDQLKDRYYEPGLWGKHLGRNPEPLRKVAAFTAPRLYPDVRVAQTDGTFRVQVDAQGGGIGRVVIMVNGKERTADARGAAADPSATTLSLEEDLTNDPRLLPGEDNQIEVFVYNAEGYLRSRGVTIAYTPAGQAEAPSLWAVIAGISDYGGETLDLRFAAKDARDFAAALTTAGRSLFGVERTHVTLLSDEGAGRDAIRAALSAARKAKAGDILLVYLAGHGVTQGESFHYLSADAATADLSDARVREATTLSSAELIEAIKLIPALKQVLILDTCASGGFIDALAGARSVPSSQTRALERVKDRTGMYILAGCAADKVSFEATQYGQGLLTYSLLLGMRGGQLREGEFVDVSTLFNFAADKVPEFARDIGGVQRPIVASPRGGSSFDIGRLTDEGRAEIPFRTARPLFLRTVLLDPDEGADVLELGHGVDQALAHETARGGTGALVFVDARQLAGAFRISGTYATDGPTTTARFRVRRDKTAVTDWVQVAGPGAGLPGRILEEVRRVVAELERER